MGTKSKSHPSAFNIPPAVASSSSDEEETSSEEEPEVKQPPVQKPQATPTRSAMVQDEDEDETDDEEAQEEEKNKDEREKSTPQKLQPSRDSKSPKYQSTVEEDNGSETDSSSDSDSDSDSPSPVKQIPVGGSDYTPKPIISKPNPSKAIVSKSLDNAKRPPSKPVQTTSSSKRPRQEEAVGSGKEKSRITREKSEMKSTANGEADKKPVANDSSSIVADDFGIEVAAPMELDLGRVDKVRNNEGRIAVMYPNLSRAKKMGHLQFGATSLWEYVDILSESMLKDLDNSWKQMNTTELKLMDKWLNLEKEESLHRKKNRMLVKELVNNVFDAMKSAKD